MAYVITDGCVSCGTCAGECPVGAISEEMASTLSTLIPASSAEPALLPVQWRYRRLIISYIRKPQSICFVVFSII